MAIVVEDPFSDAQFEPRQLWRSPSADWDKAMREQYLLKQDAEEIYSLDMGIWADVRYIRGLPPLPEHGWPFMELDELRDWVKEAGPYLPGPVALVRIERLTTPVMPVISPTEKVLGIDICDSWCLSGLANCGYSPEDFEQFDLRRFIPHLNRFHLFDDLALAHEFAEITSERVEEHSPFFPYLLTVCETYPTDSVFPVIAT